MRQFFFLLLMIALVTACSPILTNTPPPSPQPLRVAYSSTLRPMVERLHQCALEHPEIGLIIQETSVVELVSTEADLTLWFGEPLGGIHGTAFSLGTDVIGVIAGKNVSLQNISTKQLRDLYANPNSTYQVWTYSDENELRNIFDNVVLGGISSSANSLIAPNPAAMTEAIAADPLSIGYLPLTWLSGDIQTISVEQELQREFTQPILAVSQEEPAGNFRAYLVCLHNNTPEN